MEGLYAKEAPLKDDRVKELAYKDAVFTSHMYTENAVTVDMNTLRNKSAEGTWAEDSAISKTLKAADVDYGSVTKIKEEGAGKEADYARVGVEAASKTGTADELAAADIIKEKAGLEEASAVKRKGKVKTFFITSFDMMQSTFRVALLFDPEEGELDKEAQRALDKKIDKKKALTAAVHTKFASLPSFSDRLRKAKADSDKELSGPVEKTDKKYADL
tara:strand:+ start:783 stop:1433 length:651 start_codon:yes stop_codon:yes gene_type:complete